MSVPISLPQQHRAKDILTAVGRAFPGAWQQVDQLRAARGKALPPWPDWCFLPLRGAHAIVSGGSGRPLPYEQSHFPSMLGALAAWRVTQGIYRFDPTLYDELIKTPLNREIPQEPLIRLPEWCIYLETPGLLWPIAGEERPIHGAWAHLDVDDLRGGTPNAELRIVLDTAQTTTDPLNPIHGCIAIPLVGRGTVAECLESVLSFGVREARSHGVHVAEALTDPHQVARILWPIISLLLYICTEAGQIGDSLRRPANPPPKHTRHGWRHFPVDRPTTWDVGVRIGAALRRAHRQHAEEDGASTGRHLRGHVRIFHWHTFLAGPKRTERRVKWLAPISVNLDSRDSMPATVRRVE